VGEALFAGYRDPLISDVCMQNKTGTLAELVKKICTDVFNVPAAIGFFYGVSSGLFYFQIILHSLFCSATAPMMAFIGSNRDRAIPMKLAVSSLGITTQFCPNHIGRRMKVAPSMVPTVSINYICVVLLDIVQFRTTI
jgi:hypothetical protein